jgi:hypothetical protein
MIRVNYIIKTLYDYPPKQCSRFSFCLKAHIMYIILHI